LAKVICIKLNSHAPSKILPSIEMVTVDPLDLQTAQG
jgi:hypothetical protein